MSKKPSIQVRIRRLVRDARKSVAYWKERAKLSGAELSKHQKALAKSRANYQSLLADYNQLRDLNTIQQKRIWRMQEAARAIGGL